MAELPPPPLPIRCAACGIELPPTALACPACRQLRHTARLKELATQAERHEQAGDLSAALSAWRTAAELLPPDSRQFGAVQARVAALAERVDKLPFGGVRPPAPPDAGAARGAAQPRAADATRRRGGIAALLTAAALLLWKLKAVALVLLSKGKLLLAGLTKLPTLFSMIASFGLYWSLWGWKFAAGLVLSIYVHEMGHVFALARFGVKATAPMFIPGLGAVIRMKQYPKEPRTVARVGLAGPMFGLGAALACLGIHALTDQAIFAALAHVGAWINLFNLLPIFHLDGDCGFKSMTRWQRAAAVGVCALLAYQSGEGLLWLIAIVGALRLLAPAAEKADHTALIHYVFLVATLTALAIYADWRTPLVQRS